LYKFLDKVAPLNLRSIQSITVEREHDLTFLWGTPYSVATELEHLSRVLSGLANLRNLRLVFTEPHLCPHQGGVPLAEESLLAPFKALDLGEGLRVSASFW
jgi:hypothetical protein